ncbi:MAG TPA: cysteine desulfurase family protein [Propionibacteriaceae bacterium]|nr:cysteine desulfurase family protein [Propionibacteriaceae bacterium]
MTRTYLDHASTTPLLPEAIEAMTRELSRIGNASSSHSSGRAARRVVEEAREAIAAQVGAHPTELIFTSGGTEADNLAVKGGYWSQARRGRTEIVISAIEHHAVSESVAWLVAAAGATAVSLPVDAIGRLDLGALESAVTPRTAVVSVMWANNEIGTLQPIAEVAERAAEHGALSHSDAVQAVGHVAFDFRRSGLDLASFTAHKLGGPYGVGALLARREIRLTAVLHGGGQERDVRSGTLDVAAVAGFAAAVRVAVRRREQEEDRLRVLRAQLVGSVLDCVPDAVLYGTTDPAGSLPGVTTIGFPGCQAESLLLLLDAAGIDCSTGSACSAGVTEPSHVLSAIGASPVQARAALRFSLGHTSSQADVTALVAALPEAVRRARAAAAYA